MPVSFGSVDSCFVWQASSIQFLCQFNFDFNKFAYEGVPFLNEDQERELCQCISSGVLFSGLHRPLDESFIQSLCSMVATWYVSSSVGQTFTLHQQPSDGKLWNDFIIQTEIRKRFPEVWTSIDPFKNIAIERITPERRKELEMKRESDKERDQERLKQSLLGFTRVFRVMREYQKPLVGHNMLMDLLFLFDKFIHPLPIKYCSFKKQLHEIFPKIFDTKHMAFKTRKVLERILRRDINGPVSLMQLCHILESGRVTNSVMHMPKISFAKGFDRYLSKDAPHEAGFDSYQSGIIFLRLCHIIKFGNERIITTCPCSFNMYLSAAAPYCNCINVIRATLNHISLDGRDPPITRPEHLFVTCRKRSQRLNIQQLAEWFSSYGTVDVQLKNSRTALVAAGNFSCAKAILTAFQGHHYIRVTRYHFWKHSPAAKLVLWSGLVLSGGICIWAFASLIKTDS
ncbi:pre-piRNA 3'-exonuclease trimmer-like isoform X2 [Pomacea canaliculata]|nr:pre-piRNA 3'-exonuclease trimmer-like isoform X2 [Pomacea canaliculata]XP_025093056.1 pre-piRNA 3'-exonuclease trimmer-like isoform X2 [Pomacea canaliculata]